MVLLPLAQQPRLKNELQGFINPSPQANPRHKRRQKTMVRFTGENIHQNIEDEGLHNK